MNLLSDTAASLGSAADPPQLLSNVISADGRILHGILKPLKRGTSEETGGIVVGRSNFGRSDDDGGSRGNSWWDQVENLMTHNSITTKSVFFLERL